MEAKQYRFKVFHALTTKDKVESNRLVMIDFKLSCYLEVKQQAWNFWVRLFSQVLAIPPGLTGLCLLHPRAH